LLLDEILHRCYNSAKSQLDVRTAMPLKTLTLNVPDPIYSRLLDRARRANRSVEAEVLEVVAAAMPAENGLPSDYEDTLKQLTLLDDDALLRVARTRFPPESAAELEQLHLKGQRERLSEAEAERAASLVQQYERAMLVRAQAAVLLKQRGHDIVNLPADA
jgi:plasmid stability protein